VEKRSGGGLVGGGLVDGGVDAAASAVQQAADDRFGRAGRAGRGAAGGCGECWGRGSVAVLGGGLRVQLGGP
jgi:hypothetical protein